VETGKWKGLFSMVFVIGFQPFGVLDDIFLDFCDLFLLFTL
jgi:hypothetical protein